MKQMVYIFLFHNKCNTNCSYSLENKGKGVKYYEKGKRQGNFGGC